MPSGRIRVGNTVVSIGGSKVRFDNIPSPGVAGSPTITGGTAASGNISLSSAASFTGPFNFKGQVWQRDGIDTEQQSNNYVKSASDLGKQIRLKQYASGPGGSVFAYSAAISIVDQLLMTSGPLPEGQVGSPYSYTIQAAGGRSPYTFAMSTLPFGMSINSSTGVVSGTASSTGNTSYTITITDSDGIVFSYTGIWVISTTPVGGISNLTAILTTGTSQSVSFTNAANATDYQYRLNGGAWQTLSASRIITNLLPGTAYAIQVRGINAYGNGAASNTVNVTTPASSAPTVGLSYTPTYVPAWTFCPTRATLLTQLGLTTSQVITATDYASFEVALTAANAAQKPLVVGIDNGVYNVTTTQTRVYQDVPIYGYGLAAPIINAASRLSGWISVRANDILTYGIEFRNFTSVYVYAAGTLPLAIPDASNPAYDPATSLAKREPYHTSTDKLTLMSHSAVDAGYIMQAVGHFNVTGSPNLTSIKPVRMKNDGGPGGSRVPYNYRYPTSKSNWIYDNNTSGDALFATVIETNVPNLLAYSVNNATNASIVDSINANTGTSGYSAQLDPRTGKVVVLCASYYIRPFDWTVVSSGGSVSFDCVGAAVNLSYNIFSGCDRAMGGIGDVTAVGRLDLHKNVFDATWAAISLNYLMWSEIWAANNEYKNCLLTTSPYPGSGRSTQYGNAQTGATNQDGTWIWIGSNNPLYMRYIKTRGTVAHIDNNKCYNIDGNTNSDTVTSAGLVDLRLAWDNSSNKRDNHTFNYNDVKDVLNRLGAIDSQIFYLKGCSFTIVGNIFDGFGAKRRSNTRSVSNATSQGSEAGAILCKNNGYDLDPNGWIFIAGNFFTRGPNGLPWVKMEDKGGYFTVAGNHFLGWIIQLDDAIYGDANGRALTLWTGTATTNSGSATITIDSTTSGTLYKGMRIVVNGMVGHLKSGSGSTWTLASNATATNVAASATADLVNSLDGVLVRLYNYLKAFQFYGNFLENIADQGQQAVVLLHQIITVSGGTYSMYEISNNIHQNDNSADYPEFTSSTDPYYLNNGPTMADNSTPTSMILGRNTQLNAAGSVVGAPRFRKQNAYYTDNNNTTSKPYVPVP